MFDYEAAVRNAGSSEFVVTRKFFIHTGDVVCTGLQKEEYSWVSDEAAVGGTVFTDPLTAAIYEEASLFSGHGVVSMWATVRVEDTGYGYGVDEVIELHDTDHKWYHPKHRRFFIALIENIHNLKLTAADDIMTFDEFDSYKLSVAMVMEYMTEHGTQQFRSDKYEMDTFTQSGKELFVFYAKTINKKYVFDSTRARWIMEDAAIGSKSQPDELGIVVVY